MKPKRFSIRLAQATSEIVAGESVSRLPEALKKMIPAGSRVAVVSDSGVPRHVASQLLSSLDGLGYATLSISIPAGEASKTLAQVGRVYRTLAKNRFERKSWLIALGGGVVGDMTGFIAATYLRGMPFVQVPTTLLAQVDASIGGKTGVDLPEGKNLAGAFYHPRLIWIDPSLLKSLPQNHLRNGMAEVIKYGAILDAKLFQTLEAQADDLLKGYSPLWDPIIARCAQLKAQVVQKDPTETSGLRALLNFGHTVGHAVEAAGNYRDYLHGEAISIGMFVAGYLSSQLSNMPDIDRIRLNTLLTKADLPAQVKKAIPREKLMSYLLRDKKAEMGSVKFVLLKRIGKSISGQTVPHDLLDPALRSSNL